MIARSGPAVVRWRGRRWRRPALRRRLRPGQDDRARHVVDHEARRRREALRAAVVAVPVARADQHVGVLRRLDHDVLQAAAPGLGGDLAADALRGGREQLGRRLVGDRLDRMMWPAGRGRRRPSSPAAGASAASSAPASATWSSVISASVGSSEAAASASASQLSARSHTSAFTGRPPGAPATARRSTRRGSAGRSRRRCGRTRRGPDRGHGARGYVATAGSRATRCR